MNRAPGVSDLAIMILLLIVILVGAFNLGWYLYKAVRAFACWVFP